MSPDAPRIFNWPWRSRSTIAREVDDELDFHLAMRVAELVDAGANAEEARARAIAEFGDLERTRAYCRAMDERIDRDARHTDQWNAWRQDVRYGLRTLRRSPAFALVSLVTLALAIGVNTAVFSVTRAVLLSPLPYAVPSRLVHIYGGDRRTGVSTYPFSPADFVDFRAQQTTFSGLAAAQGYTGTWVPDRGDPEIVSGILVTANMFAVLGVPARYGHTFVSGDDEAGRDMKVVLTDRFWRRAFGGDSTIVGRRISLSGTPYTVIGVMPRGFTLGWNEDLFLPLTLSADLADPVRARKQHYLHVFGRLAPNITLNTARADLATIAQRLEAAYPDANTGRTVALVSLRDDMTGSMQRPLVLLQLAALMVLLIACANLANLTLSRALGRRRELAVRAALGAGRRRLAGQLLAESLLLAAAGGVLGVVVALVGTRALLTVNPDALPAMFHAAIDGRVLLFSLALAVLTGVLFGLAPALGVARTDLHDSLKEGGRGASGGRGRERLRRSLAIAQIALAAMLLVGSGLLLRSFSNLIHGRIGFAPDHVLTAQLRAAGERYDSAAAVNRFYESVLRDLAAQPGVIAAGAATMLPTQGSVGTSLRIVGEPVDEAHLPDLGYIAVRGAYFAAMRIPLMAGRLFDSADRPDGPPVALINQTAARRFFPRGDAVGRRIRIGPDPHSTPITIVGVVGDIRDEGLGVPPRPTLFADHTQQAWDRSMSLVVRTAGDPRSIEPSLRQAVHAADPLLAVRNVMPLEDVLGASLAARRFSLGLVSCFAAIALLLAAVGVYGVLSYGVSARTREFGVRMALGATSRDVLLLVLRQGLGWSLFGLALGLVGAVSAGRLVAGLLYGVGAVDAPTYGLVAVGLLVVVAVACAVPAWRAARVDPLTSMRAD